MRIISLRKLFVVLEKIAFKRSFTPKDLSDVIWVVHNVFDLKSNLRIHSDCTIKMAAQWRTSVISMVLSTIWHS